MPFGHLTGAVTAGCAGLVYALIVGAIIESFRFTLLALCAPRRLIPIAVVVVPLLVAQERYSREYLALPIGAALAGSFILIAPALWRVLFPIEGKRASLGLGLLIYSVTGALLVVSIGRLVPAMFGVGYTFLTTKPSLAVSTALFWVGGWGLARDVDLEANLGRARERADLMQKEAEHAQLIALKNHFDPHFLFNTLNAIAEWCREDGEVAERAILELSSMLRTVMTGIKETSWPLDKEVGLSLSLFDLHRIRDPKRFLYKKEFARLPDISVPPMLLLPLSENAMKHGPAAGNRGDVILRVKEDGEHIVIEVENPGQYKGRRAGGTGVEIVEKRLRLSYGSRAKVTIEGIEGGPGEPAPRTLARITLPRTQTTT